MLRSLVTLLGVALLGSMFVPAIAFSQALPWLVNPPGYDRPSPQLGEPGCWMYSVMLEEVDDPYSSDPSAMTLRIDTSKTVVDLVDACPPEPQGASGGCPYATLTNYLPLALPNDPNVDPSDPMLCKPGYTCGGTDLDGNGKLEFGCVSACVNAGQPNECCLPMKMINGVCQYDQCPGGCAAGEACKLQILDYTAGQEGLTVGADVLPLWYCEPEPGNGGGSPTVVNACDGETPKMADGTEIVVPCPIGCPSEQDPNQPGKLFCKRQCGRPYCAFSKAVGASPRKFAPGPPLPAALQGGGDASGGGGSSSGACAPSPDQYCPNGPPCYGPRLASYPAGGAGCSNGRSGCSNGCDSGDIPQQIRPIPIASDGSNYPGGNNAIPIGGQPPSFVSFPSQGGGGGCIQGMQNFLRTNMDSVYVSATRSSSSSSSSTMSSSSNSKSYGPSSF